MTPLVSVITPTTGDPLLRDALESVAAQSYRAIQHLVVIDGAERAPAAHRLLQGATCDIVELPYATGTDGYLGHRIYGAATHLARGDLLCFLDEDNWMDKDHVESLVEVIRGGAQWAFSLRKIVDRSGRFICRDDCESLGKWPTAIAPDDYLVDVNCFMLPMPVAIMVSPIWRRRARQPGVVEVDRMMTQVLRKQTRQYESSSRYSMNYRVGATELSVTAKFFLAGNAEMARRHAGAFPWSARGG